MEKKLVPLDLWKSSQFVYRTETCAHSPTATADRGLIAMDLPERVGAYHSMRRIVVLWDDEQRQRGRSHTASR
jgi:hypothetical protein